VPGTRRCDERAAHRNMNRQATIRKGPPRKNEMAPRLLRGPGVIVMSACQAGGSVSVSQHLGIKLSEYDHRIRTFVPFYEEMLDVVADTVFATCGTAPRITDLGIGTGALSARCL